MKKIALNYIAVSTRLYTRSYGKQPRGKGTWAFSIGDTKGYEDPTEALFVYNKTYSEALKIARLEAQNQNAELVYVLP